MDTDLIVIALIPASIIFAFIFTKLTKNMTAVSEKYKAPTEVVFKIDLVNRIVYIQKSKELFNDVETMPYESFISHCKVKSRVIINEAMSELSQSKINLVNPKRLEIFMRYKGEDVPYILVVQKYNAKLKLMYCYLKYNPISTSTILDYHLATKNIVPFSLFKDRSIKQAQKNPAFRNNIHFIKISGASKLTETFEANVANLIIKETVKRISFAFGMKVIISQDLDSNIWIYRPISKTKVPSLRNVTKKYLRGVQKKITQMKLEEAVKIQTKLIIGTAEWSGDLSRQSFDICMKRAIYAQNRAWKEGSISNYFTKKDEPDFREEINITTQIRKAIQAKNIEIKYQPIITLFDGKSIGYTVTSKFPSIKVSFSKVIKLVNRYIGATEFNILLIKAAIAKTKDTKTDIYLNFDAKIAFQMENMIDLFKEWGWNIKKYVLELTNSGALTVTEMKKLCIKLKRAKIRICVDNYDDNYESPSNIGQFTPESIKIRKFVSHIHTNDESLVKVIEYVTQCKKKNVKLIATRVESEYEMYVLTRIGVNAAEGHFLSKPSYEKETISDDLVMDIIKSRKNIFLE